MGLKQWANAALRKLPLAPKHVDRNYERRVANNAHIPKQGARRVSFRRFWGGAKEHAMLRYLPNRQARRRAVRGWWKEALRGAKE